jgi:lipoate-protein ligase A
MDWILMKEASYSGAENMALDAYLLHNPPPAPVLRFYRWSPPAVSLGYHQKVPNVNKVLLDRYGFDLVRRPTGGRAVFHNQEITYAVIIPATTHLFTLSIHELYYQISRIIVESLQRAGIPAIIEWNRPKQKKTEFTPGECFASIARFEVKIQGRKMVGSAQRRMSRAILQHGSILLVDEQYVLETLLNAEFSGGELLDHNKSVVFIDSKIPREDIINEMIVTFERNFRNPSLGESCGWITDYDVSEFWQNKDSFIDKFSIYKAKPQSESALFM